MFRCPPFDLNDRALIEGARRTGHPPIVASAVQAAVAGFRARMLKRGKPPVVKGEYVVSVCKPKNFFDDYCQAIVFQEICDVDGMGLARVMWEAPANQKQPASPDVEFIYDHCAREQSRRR